MPEEDENEATYRLGMPRRPDLTDELIAWVTYRGVRLRVIWHAADHNEVMNLLNSLTDNNFWEQARQEWEVAAASHQIDGDLSSLFSNLEGFEEEEGQ